MPGQASLRDRTADGALPTDDVTVCLLEALAVLFSANRQYDRAVRVHLEQASVAAFHPLLAGAQRPPPQRTHARTSCRAASRVGSSVKPAYPPRPPVAAAARLSISRPWFTASRCACLQGDRRRNIAHVVALVEEHNLYDMVADQALALARADPTHGISLFVDHIDQVHPCASCL